MTKRNTLILTTFFAIAFSASVNAQSNTVAAAGDATGAGGSVSYTVGQMDYQVLSSMDGSVEEGLQHAYEISVVTGMENKDINLTAAVYPNPATEFVKLSVEGVDLSAMSYSMTDAVRKIIVEHAITDAQTTISLNGLACGAYYIKVSENSTAIKLFKIIKNN